MALSIVQLFQPVVLGTSSGVLYSMPTLPTTSVLKNGRVRLTNTTGGPVAATLYAAPSATASAASNCFLSGVSIAAGASLDVDVPSLAAGDTLRGLAGAGASISVHEMGGVLYSA
jgi:hypothetical protein